MSRFGTPQAPAAGSSWSARPAGEDCTGRTGELGVAVSDEEPEGTGPVHEVHDHVAGLLGNP